MQLIETIIILFLIMGTGFIARKTGIIPASGKKVLSSFVYYIALPALFFSKISKLDILSIPGAIYIGSFFPILIILMIIFIFFIAGIIKKREVFLFAIGIIFGSNAFFGIPFFSSLFGESGERLSVISAAVLGMAGIVGAMILFEWMTTGVKPLEVLLSLSRNPLIISIVLGIGASFLPKIPSPVLAPFEFVSQAAGVVALFSLGMFVHDNLSLKVFKESSVFILFRVILLPLAAFLTVQLIGGEVLLSQFLFIQGGIPVAASVAILAERYDVEKEPVTGIVVGTSVLSLLLLPLLYAISLIFR